jgi:organic radical activating enzyme
MVEWELTLKCNYSCDYCGLLRPIQEQTDEKLIYDFIKTLNEKYSTIELFLFGGEPFLHPKIEFIINTLQSFNQPFMIQSNLSNTSTKIIQNLNVKPFKLCISVHISQTTITDICRNIVIAKPDEIHLMYTENTGNVEKFYKRINIIKGDSKLILTPVSNLACDGYDDVLIKYNEIKDNFEHDENMVTYNGVEMLRSDIWMLQNKTDYSLTKGKTCQYLNEYVLYTPELKPMNCCYRKSTNGICDEQNCFFM